MTDILQTAMAPVLTDLRRTGAPFPRLGETTAEHGGAMVSVMLWSTDGGGAGVNAALEESPVERVARAADMVQEWVIEELWGVAWPECPRHPGSHPLTPLVVGGSPQWVCPRDDVAVYEIGALGVGVRQ